MKVNGPGRYKLVQGRNPWQQEKHAWPYSDLIQTLKGEPWSSGFPTDGSLTAVLPNTAEPLSIAIKQREPAVLGETFATLRETFQACVGCGCDRRESKFVPQTPVSRMPVSTNVGQYESIFLSRPKLLFVDVIFIGQYVVGQYECQLERSNFWFPVNQNQNTVDLLVSQLVGVLCS